jgi:hypothetical protein
MAKRLLVLVAFVLLLADPASAMRQGFYESCRLAAGAECAQRVQKLGAAGFDYVINVPGAPKQSAAYAQAAHVAGVEVIWSIGTYDLKAATSAVSSLKGLPATAGYYLVDEPPDARHDEVKAIATMMDQADPARFRVLMRPWKSENTALWSDVPARIGTDPYPVGAAPEDPRGVYDVVRNDGKGFDVLALQAWRRGDSFFDSGSSWTAGAKTRFPTRREITAMRDAAVDNGASLALWFWLPSTLGWPSGQRPWYWTDPPDPEQRWQTVTQGAFAKPTPRRTPRRPHRARRR